MQNKRIQLDINIIHKYKLQFIFFSNFFLYFFNWRIIALQIFFSVKHQYESATGIHMPPPSWTSLPCPSPSHPSSLIQSSCLNSLSHTGNSHWLSILNMAMWVSMLLFPYISPSYPPHCVHKYFFYVFFSTTALQINSLLPSF